MISKEVYRILHGIDSSLDQATIHLNWLNVKADDPRLIKVRKILKATERPKPKRKKVIVHRKDTYKYNDEKILKMITEHPSIPVIAREVGIPKYTLYAHVKKTPRLNIAYEKSQYEFSTIVAYKGEKVCAIGRVGEISTRLKLKKDSISSVLVTTGTLFGYSFMRLRDWRKTHE